MVGLSVNFRESLCAGTRRVVLFHERLPLLLDRIGGEGVAHFRKQTGVGLEKHDEAVAADEATHFGDAAAFVDRDKFRPYGIVFAAVVGDAGRIEVAEVDETVGPHELIR